MKPTTSKYIYKGNVYTILLIRLLIILFVLSISRMSLYFFNPNLFAGFSTLEIFNAYFQGLRFDLSILFMISPLLILGNALPLGARRNPVYQKIINTITLIFMVIAISFNFADSIYYRFTLKRMTFDIFTYLQSMNVFWDVAPRFLIDFWYAFILSMLLIAFLIYLFTRFRLNRKVEKTGWRFYTWHSALFLISAVLIIIGIRGGTQLKPINIVDASLHAPARLTTVVLNTPFTIIKSYGQTGLELKNDFTEEELVKIYSPIHTYKSLENKPDSIKNVVVLILESFSSEHIGYLNSGKSFTPFLDSLFEHSLVFKATANGKRSIEGIPAILSSLPTLFDESFLNGPYAANQMEGLAAVLDKYQYKTAFFHGGKNGTMSFDSYAFASGFQKYFGMNEYPNQKDFDGHWGIWDEPYLQYFASSLNEFQEPFLGALFTLSSHHPYLVPKQYKNSLPVGSLEIQQSIAYTDLALRKFFETAQKMNWFANTLFVITADHTSEGASALYQNSLGQFSIPIAFYTQNDSLLRTRSSQSPVQQIDIFPSIIQYLGIKDSILCFGNSVFDSVSHPFAINYFNRKLQILDSSALLQVDDQKAIGLYLYKQDSLLQNNLVNQLDYSSLMLLQKAMIQQYNNRMIQNKLTINRHE